MSQVDILAVAAHPDDVELSCSGTIIKHVKQGKKCAVTDLTRGELGTRGTPELRLQEAEKASEIMSLTERHNMGMADGFFEINKASIIEIAKEIRYFKPRILLCNAPRDRHPDHGRAAELVKQAAFYSGLRKIETTYNGTPQEPHRPDAVYQYIQDRFLEPDFVVDISDEWDAKMKSIEAYGSQFYSGKNSDSKEPQTPISTKEFVEFLKGRAGQFGRMIGRKYGEGFVAVRTPGVDDLTTLT